MTPPELARLTDRELLETTTAEVLRIGRVVDGLLRDFAPMISAWRSTNGGTVGLARAARSSRRAMRGAPPAPQIPGSTR